jgi:hypothetical protein
MQTRRYTDNSIGGYENRETDADHSRVIMMSTCLLYHTSAVTHIFYPACRGSSFKDYRVPLLHGKGNKKRTALPACQGWRLVITGHSLGAGVATFLGLYFKQAVPNVRVWCFSPPGALMSPSLAEHTLPFVTTCVYNKDMVPRCDPI